MAASNGAGCEVDFPIADADFLSHSNSPAGWPPGRTVLLEMPTPGEPFRPSIEMLATGEQISSWS